MSEGKFNHLEHLQNDVGRVILDQPPLAYSQLRLQLHWLPVRDRVQFQILLLVLCSWLRGTENEMDSKCNSLLTQR